MDGSFGAGPAVSMASWREHRSLIVSTTTWKQVRKWKWDIGALRVIGVSPDGTLAAAGGPTGKIVVWDLDL